MEFVGYTGEVEWEEGGIGKGYGTRGKGEWEDGKG